MKKLILALLGITMSFAYAFSQGFPTISTDGQEKWYLIQFKNGGNAFTAATTGEITTSAVSGDDSQLWKITGNSTDGYTITNKKNYILYVNSALKNQMVNAGTAATGVSKFLINETRNSTYPGAFEIQPKGNTNISMNLWVVGCLIWEESLSLR